MLFYDMMDLECVNIQCNPAFSYLLHPVKDRVFFLLRDLVLTLHHFASYLQLSSQMKVGATGLKVES